MRIKKKENQGITISVSADYKNYKSFLKKVKKLAQQHEAKSNVDKLDYSILFNCQKLPYMPVKGWCSRCVDNNGKISEVFFCDYDNVLFRIVESEARYLQEEYNLPPIYIFKTEEMEDCNGELYGNYHLVCLSKLRYRDIIHMQNELHCDQAFKKIPLIYRFRTYVLRLGEKGKRPKPVLKGIIGDLSKEYNQEVSQPHLECLKAIYPKLPKVKYTNLDGNDISKLVVTVYSTASNVKKKNDKKM